MFPSPRRLSKCIAFHPCLHVHCRPEFFAGEDSAAAQLLLDAQDLVELGETLASCGGTGLDLSAPDADDDIGDGHVFRFAGAVRHHDAPSSGEGIFGGLNSFGDGADLVDFEEEGIAGLELDGLFDERGVGDSQVISG
jgi:hypothetical protein